MEAERARAPDLFRALELEPIPGAPTAVPEEIEERSSEEVTNPVAVGRPAESSAPEAGAPVPAKPSPALAGPFSGLADVLEPDESGEGRMPDITPPPQIMPEDPVEDVAAGPTVPWAWVSVSLLLAGGLGYVLYTETDLFSGNVIEKRDAEVAAEVAEERAQLEADAKASQTQYGAVQLNTTPDGARVFMMKNGPEASFEGIPVDGEYMVLVEAPQHVPRTRVVKGSEIGSPIILDLDLLPEGGAAPPIPDEEVVPTPPPAGAKETGTLVIRTGTEGARVGLLVGFTPGVTVVNLDVKEAHQFLVTKGGFENRELLLKGRHFDETSDGALLYMDTLELTPAEEVPLEAAGTGGEAVATDGEAAPAAEEPPAPTKKKRKKKKRRKKKRR